MMVLIFVCLAYYWQSNAIHEAAGLIFFSLLSLHVRINSNWSAMRKVKKTSLITLGIVVLIMFITSIMRSIFIYETFGYDGGVRAKKLHASVGYWLMIIASIHIGQMWPKVLMVMRLHNLSSSLSRFLKIISIVPIIIGLIGFYRLRIYDKLLMNPNMDFWYFKSSTTEYFLYVISVSVFIISVTYYSSKLLRKLPLNH